MRESGLGRRRLLSAALAALVALGAACGGGRQSTVKLLPSNEVPPVTDSQATGEATATLDADGLLEVEGRFAGLSGTLFAGAGTPPSAAHVHLGAAGENGAPVFSLQVTADNDQRGGTFRGNQALTAEQKAAFLGGRLYVNVHSAAYTGGELRGQFTP
jgi:hypothetical protein